MTDALRRHYSNFWAGRKHKEFEWAAGLIGMRLPEFRVRRIVPGKRSGPCVYVAYFHADPKHRLTIGSTMNIGRPWMDGAKADHLLVSLPYPYGPALEHCDADGMHVKTLWLVPITAAEAAYRHEHGLEALEQLLETDGVDMMSPRRLSLV